MKLQELKNEEMYVLVAPDGNPQVTTLANEYTLCIAMIQMLAQSGIGQPFGRLIEQGYQILPVHMSMTQNGSADDAFNKSKTEVA